MSHCAVLEQVRLLWNERIPFNKVIGIEITDFNPELTKVCFNWKPELVGNPIQNILHGGVTATALDFAGGVVCSANVISQLDNPQPEQLMTALAKLGTIDLRTDFLRPGRGKQFITTARIIRAGKKVAVARMEMHNEVGEHLAFGTGTYMVG